MSEDKQWSKEKKTIEKVRDMITCISDIRNNFIYTNEITPAHGECFVDKANDMVAIIYKERAKVFFNRGKEFEGHEYQAYIYNNMLMLTK